MGKTPAKRHKVMQMLQRRRHRYVPLRVLSQTFSLGVLAAVPLCGLARVDFWGGDHQLLMRPAGFKPALAGVIVGIAAMYVVTFLSNVVAGRMFCGWGCPVAQVCRLGEAIDAPRMRLLQRLRLHVEAAAFSLLLVVSVLAWWVDLRVLLLGSTAALLITWSLVLIGVAGAYLHGRWWRWGFCKSACPIGLYYSFVAPAQYFGVHFRNRQQTCIDCNACDNICPVDLDPRRLALPVVDRQGVSLPDAPGFNHCLECGDCVRACERMIEVSRPNDFPQAVPLRLGYFKGPQSDEDQASKQSAA